MKKSYVIIGNSIASAACIEGIRSVDKEGKITVISAEKYPVYGRPLISYYLLGRIKRENMGYKPADFYERNGVEVLYDRVAVKIDPEKKCVVLRGGDAVPYDKLLVATGSRPFVPAMEGLESVKKKFSFMTMDDALSLEKALKPESRVLVVGAGLIGLKCVEGISDRVKSVTVVDMADRILPSILDKEGAEIIQRGLEERGVNFYLSDSVERFEGNTAYLKNSKKSIKFDILVIAVGVRPNIELVEKAHGETGRGITVDYGMRTSIPDVYAAGDCTEGYDSAAGVNRVLALLPNANFQGRVAGVNMAGGIAVLKNAIPLNAIGFFGSHVLTAGVYEGDVYSDINGDEYRKLFVKDGKLVGFILINDFLRAGIYTSLVREKTPLDEVDFDMLKFRPELLAFSVETRKEKLARRV